MSSVKASIIMKDFTLNAYRQYLVAIKNSYSNIICFADFLSSSIHSDSFFIIRHDIDRKPDNALKMALLENEIGICSTYYFRTKWHVFKPEIIRKIAEAGHEIGYHYESLSDTRGDLKTALNDFEKNLNRLRKQAPIKTIAMHGRPLSPYDNRDMWRNLKNQEYLKNHLGIYGEVYLDIDYTDIAYITDTGRNWNAGKANRRDTVGSSINSSFENGEALLDCFKKACYSKVILQIHPERWTNPGIDYHFQWAKDQLANKIKSIIR